MTSLAPVFYLPHGGGPLPLMDDPAHRSLSGFLRTVGARFPQPDSIVLISAHWEAPVPTINAGAAPALLFDYYGFPPETYRLTYPAPGNPPLAAYLAELLQADGLSATLDTARGFDHGVFVPLKLMYPDAAIPVVQLSMIGGLDAALHIRLGRCLAPLRERNVAIIGSGMSFHNLQAIFAGEQPQLRAASDQFDAWLVDTLCNPHLPAATRIDALTRWTEAPGARFSHPRAEHLLPLHVCFGAASATGSAAQVLFNEPLMGHKVSGFGWY
jgi:aromatic ring-opening dioxygenase catalytic subunit (LigB family)